MSDEELPLPTFHSRKVAEIFTKGRLTANKSKEAKLSLIGLSFFGKNLGPFALLWQLCLF